MRAGRTVKTAAVWAGMLIVSLSVSCGILMIVFAVGERSFAVPVHTVNGGVAIRNDNYGEGYFGAKRRGGRKHSGLDIACEIGDSVIAAKSGWAVCEENVRGYGKLIIIYHPDGAESRYAHLDRFCIDKSQWVFQGEVIGAAGKSGNAGHAGIDPHLHFEIRRGGRAVDPARYIRRKGLEAAETEK
ncbi:MAG: M23 family metallopeptidase [Candidatus Omnitrophota bacterium]